MRSPASYERGTTDEAAWRAVTTSADAALAGIAHGYTELREWSYRPVERSEVASVEPVLIIELDDPLLVADVADHASPRMWQAFGAGISQGPTSTLHSGTQHCVEVRLTPLGLYRMSGVAMDEVSNRVVSLEDLFGQNGRYLPERLAVEPDWTRRFDLLDSMFMRAVADGPEPDVEVEFAWDWLNRTGGTAIIGEILAEIGWSRARLARRFRSQVGLTPKAAARVLRFRRAMTLSAPGHRSLSSIALACSYFDQAHFNRDFRMLAGCSPREWAGLRHDDLLGCGIPMAGEHLYKTGADGGPSVGAIR